MIEYDSDKDARNVTLRGISLAAVETLLAGPTIERVDSRRSYGETRIIAIGQIDGIEYVCVYTQRGEVLRAISLRRANRKERDAYREAKTGS